jgi:high-affinity nickel-transport protein
LDGSPWVAADEVVGSVTIGSVVGETFGLGLVVSAFFFGFRHGIDWDHIAAISDIAGSQEDRKSAFLFGTLYALGHALVVFLIGSGAIVLGERLPPGIDRVMERVVGVTLIILGVFVFVSIARHGREFRLRSRWMLIFTGIRNLYRRVRPSDEDAHDQEPVHVHAGGVDADGGMALTGDDIPVSRWHHGHHGHPGHHHHKHPEPTEAFMTYGKASAFVVGMIHGVGAETPTQLVIFLAAAGAGGRIVGEIVLAAFISGLLTSNSLITFGSALGFLKASENWRIYLTVAVITASFSLLIGSLFLFGRGSILPTIFGG